MAVEAEELIGVEREAGVVPLRRLLPDSRRVRESAPDPGARDRDWQLAAGPDALAFDFSAGDRVVAARIPDDAGFDAAIRLVGRLPPGTYRLEPDLPPGRAESYLVGWGVGQYRYRIGRTAARVVRRLIAADETAAARAIATIRADRYAREFVDAPPNRLGPREIATHAAALAREFGASFRCVEGAELESQYPLVAAVGRASARAPLLVDLRWGAEDGSRVTIVGKGVCFDCGGLNLKSSAGMALMKKDMAGAAQALALARLVMESRLPVRLRVLVPAVENSVGPDAMRPQDVLPSRSGLTIELDDTDAEGRLILADALYEADCEQPELVLDFATLTSAQRIACGFEVAGFFSNDDAWASRYDAAARAEEDAVWRLPLHQPYRRLLASDVADLSNCGQRLHGGAIQAALFLESFLPRRSPWIHVDFYGWRERDGARPAGAWCQGLRAAFRMLKERYAGVVAN